MSPTLTAIVFRIQEPRVRFCENNTRKNQPILTSCCLICRDKSFMCRYFYQKETRSNHCYSDYIPKKVQIFDAAAAPLSHD